MDILQYTDSAAIRKAIAAIENPREIRILFVCLGNICRSPAAEGLMLEVLARHDDTTRCVIDSAGTGNYHVGDLPDSRMRAHARRRGIELTHRCRQVHESDFFDFDIIIGMDHSNLSRLRAMAPTVQTEDKILPMAAFFGAHSRFDHVPDPYYDGAEGFETVLDILSEATENLYDTITAHLPDARS